MKKFICILFSLAFSNASFAQSVWFSQNPYPTAFASLSSTNFVDNNTGWVVGAGGIILRTTNSGSIWTQQSSGTGFYLTSVHFVDNNTGWAVGEGGIILRTTNSGSIWTQQSSGTGNGLTSVHFVDNNTGWAVSWGGTILRTTNRGETWTQQSSGTGFNLTYVHFVDNNTGWVVGHSGIILRTTNSGSIWTQQSSGANQYLESVHFVDNNTGWAVGGEGAILRTTNRGETWTQQESVYSFLLLESVFFIDNNNGFVVGLYGTIQRTTNSGSNWTQIYGASPPHKLNSIHFADNNTGWAVGEGGTILRTTTGGESWESQNYYLNIEQLFSVHFVDNNTGWAVGNNGTIVRTTNSGSNWTPQTSPTDQNLQSVHFIDNNTGLAVGWSVTILRTTNSGSTWTQQSSGANQYLESVHFVDNNTAWAVGWSGTILKTTNSGASWTEQTNGTGNGLTSVHFVDNNTGWAVGNNGTIVSTTNSGSIWTQQTSGTGSSFSSVYFVDNNTGWVVGAGGIILRTTNSGATWTQQTSGTNGNLESVHFVDNNTGWAVGWSGTILRTTNSGSNWIQQTSGTWDGLSSVHFVDNNTGWVVGSGGIILKTTNGGNIQNILDPLNGNYTVGANGDFSSISEAVNSLVTNGISGSVVFNILPGIYNDNVIIDSIPGMDSTKLLTFKSLTNNPSDVTWEYSSNAFTSDSYTNVAFEGLRFRCVAVLQDLKYSLLFRSRSDLIRITNCQFEGNGIYADNSNIKRIEIQRNVFEHHYWFNEGYYVYLRDTSDYKNCSAIVDENQFDINRQTMYISGHDSMLIQKNVHNFPGKVIVKSCKSSLVCQKNKWYGSGAEIIFQKCRSPRNLLANNYLDIFQGYLLLDSCSNSMIVYNTLRGGMTLLLAFTGDPSNIYLLNNIILNADYAFSFDDVSLSAQRWNYNNVFVQQIAFGTINSINVTGLTFDQWKVNTGFDSNSVSKVVSFESDGLHLTGYSIGDDSLRGIPIPAVIEDIDGNPRDPTRPFMGADEPVFEFMNGTYTIGPDGDFPNITAAVSSLVSKGVNGPVVFDIMSGNYNEQVTIDTVSGVNSSNTVTFQSQSGNASEVNLYSTSSSTFAWNINGADHLIFKNLTFQDSLPGHGGGATVALQFNSNHISFLDNNFISGVNNASSRICISSGNHGGNLIFRRNIFRLASTYFDSRQAIFLGSTSVANCIELSNNYFFDFTHSITIQNTDSILIEKNVINGGAMFLTQSTAVNLVRCNDFRILKNEINASYDCGPGGNPGIAMFLNECDNSLIANNFFRFVGCVCLAFNNCNNLKFIYNTVVSNGGENPLNISMRNCFSTSFVNNLYRNARYGWREGVIYDFGNSVFTSNYNAFSYNAQRIAIFNSVNIPNLQTWRSVTGNDNNSNVSAFDLVSSTDLHLAQSSFGNALLLGTPDSSVLDDIDGEQRNPVRPYMGADEPDISWGLTLKVKLLTEGRYSPNSNVLSVRDSIKIIVRGIEEPYVIVDSASGIIDSISFESNFEFPYLSSGRYYIVVKQFNSIETWSKVGGEIFSSLDTVNYDFTTSASQAYGDNLKLKGEKYCMISGDVFQDGYIDGSDMLIIDNDAYTFASGRFLPSDLNGDGFTDAADMQIADNNNSREVIRP